KDLPVELPKVKKYQPTDTGESPLAVMEKWVNVKCPRCSSPAKRETDTMPNWAGSNWYYLAYPLAEKLGNLKSKILNHKSQNIFEKNKNILNYWLPVDWYNGGMEHTTLHLLYSRFIFKFLWDIKAVPKQIGPEPYQKRTSHGVILGPGGVKMSKSKGNVINPDDVAQKYGADTLRIYEMFIGPFEQMISWDTKGIIGARRFLEKVYKLLLNSSSHSVILQNNRMTNDSLLKNYLNKTIKKVSEDIEEMKFNTAVSAMMTFVNEWGVAPEGLDKKSLQKFLVILSPFAPHLAEELWQNLKFKGQCSRQKWPNYDEKSLKQEKILLIVQINGKIRDKIEIPADISQSQAEKLAMKSEKIKGWISGKKINKIVFVPDKLINIVI
ncbi:MAG: class I tRNA ligase family protein, partial [Patescibacteria group bacterium]